MTDKEIRNALTSIAIHCSGCGMAVVLEFHEDGETFEIARDEELMKRLRDLLHRKKVSLMPLEDAEESLRNGSKEILCTDDFR